MGAFAEAWQVVKVTLSEPAPYERSERPLRRPPDQAMLRGATVTRVLIAINVVFFVLEEYWGGATHGETLVRMGAQFSGAPPLIGWLSTISYGYLHIGALHIGMNMLGLWNLGRALEPMLGGARFFVLYTLSLVGGGIAISMSGQQHVTAGASGALFGLLGAVSALLYQRYRQTFFDQERAEIRRMIGGLLLPNILISLLPGVSFLGHAGGLATGALFMAPIAFRRVRRRKDPTPPGSTGITVLAVVLALLTAAAIARVWLFYEPWSESSEELMR